MELGLVGRYSSLGVAVSEFGGDDQSAQLVGTVRGSTLVEKLIVKLPSLSDEMFGLVASRLSAAVIGISVVID